MPSLNWHRVEKLYHEIVELPLAEREQFLHIACAEDPPEVRIKVEKLLRSPPESQEDEVSWFDSWLDVLKARLREIIAPSTARRIVIVRDIRPPELPNGDLQVLLRKRLLFAAALVACLYAVYLSKIAMFYEGYRFEQYTLGNWVAFVLVHTTTFTCATFAVLLLRSNIRLSVRHLRLIELVVVGLPLLDQAWLEQQRFFRDHRLFLVLQKGIDPIATGRAHVMPWFALIIGYGVLIPNTGRRCFAVISALAGAALAINLVAAIAEEVVFHPAVLHHLLEVSLWLGFAVAFTVYNAYRIEQLQRFAGYRLRRWLGGGGMGDVYLAVNELSQRACAIKLIQPERADDPKLLEIFRNGAAKAATLAHPNIVEIFDYGMADDGRFYYAMDYLDGPDLYKLVEEGRRLLPHGRVVSLLRQVCGALACVHAAGLVHRDIKPSNIIVCPRDKQLDVAKLLDIDLLVDPDEEHPDPGAAWAAPDFASPEQKAGRKLDQRSDLYSLGVTAYYLLTGNPPSAELSDGQWVNVPSDLQEVVLRCLEMEPARRFQSADELEEAFAGCACAAQWDRTKAAAWWREHGAEYRAEPEDA